MFVMATKMNDVSGAHDAFFNNSALSFELIWPEKTNYGILKYVYFCSKNAYYSWVTREVALAKVAKFVCKCKRG